MFTKKIFIGSDHGGFQLKKSIIEHLIKNFFDVTDCGTFDENSIDYPIIAQKVAESIVKNQTNLVEKDQADILGILICGTGIGMSIAANKIKGIRACTVTDSYSAEMSRKHNNANILCLGQRVIGTGLAINIVDTFLNARFDGERHLNRILMIE